MSVDPRHLDQDALRDDLAAYSLGALPANEAAALEQHLENCQGCRERLRWLSPAVDLLPIAVQQRTPPERLRENLLAIVRTEAATAGGAAHESAGAHQPAAPSEPTSGTSGSWWRGLHGLLARPAFGLAAMLLLVVGIGGGYLLRGGDESQGTTFAKAEPANRALGKQVSATLERDGESATLHVHKLPALERDQVYEVWVQRAGVMEPSSIFVLSKDGTGEAAIPGPLSGASAIYVTREPRGGSSKPTGDPLLSAPL